ncbi:MAG: hypothetical protein OSJ54_12075 [Oscillospiraceae bacterium]|nr:hypothetical protein [Oscillospiraceae bacterium]
MEENTNTVPENNPAGNTPQETENAKPAETTPAEKTFTQKELDDIVKQRLDRAKKDIPSKEELKAFRDWRDSQKTAEQKAADDLAAANSAKEAVEREKQALEIKVACLSKGVFPEAAEDVIALAARLTDDNTSIEKAVDKVLEKYPAFLGKPPKKTTTGVKTGDTADSSGTSPTSFIETVRANQVKRK